MKRRFMRDISITAVLRLCGRGTLPILALFRSIALVTDQFNATVGVFQVYALEGIGKGIENGKFAGTQGEPRLLLDREFENMDEAARQFKELMTEAELEGFQPMTIWDQIEFEDKARASRTKL
jgi:hypothetical protein